MKNSKISRALGQIDEELVAGAMEKKKRASWLRWAAAAACLCMVAACIWAWPGQEQPAYDRVERVVYQGVDYWVCTPDMVDETGRTMFALLGLPEIIDESHIGEVLGYFYRDDTNTWNQTETMGADGAILYEYGPQHNSNIYILCFRGQYYPAVRHDSDGYHGLPN